MIKIYSGRCFVSKRNKGVQAGKINCKVQSKFDLYKGKLPWSEKNNYITLYIIKVLYSIIVEKFKNKILYHDFDITAEGPIGTLVINELKENVKRITVDLEENLFG